MVDELVSPGTFIRLRLEMILVPCLLFLLLLCEPRRPFLETVCVNLVSFLFLVSRLLVVLRRRCDVYPISSSSVMPERGVEVTEVRLMW